MNSSDYSILKHLRKDSRTSISGIAIKESMALTTVFERVARIKKELGMRMCMIPFFPGIGYPVCIYATLGFSRIDQAENALSFLGRNTSVNNLFLSECHVIAEMLFKDIASSEDALSVLREMGLEVEFHYIVEAMKIEGFSPTNFSEDFRKKA